MTKSEFPLTRRRAAALCAVVLITVAAILLLRTGASADSVATVDGQAIEKKSFDHWLAVAARSNGRPGAGTPASDEDGDAQLRNQVMQLLISSAWIEREAADRDIEVSERQVDRAFADERRRRFGDEQRFRAYLKRSGQTEADVVERVRLDLLAGRIRADVVKDAGGARITQADVAAFHRKNPTRFRDPERRDLRAVVTKTRAGAVRAEAALARGDSWPSVVRRFSTDPASRRQGGKLSLARGQQDERLERAVFAARKGEVTGPVKTRFGFYVLEVQSIDRPARPPLAQTAPRIRRLLEARQEQRALDAYARAFREKWRKQTECAEGYVVADCANAAGRRRS